MLFRAVNDYVIFYLKKEEYVELKAKTLNTCNLADLVS